MNETLIIEIPYAGMGDHLFHSHLPRIAKETGSYKKILISRRSPVRQNDIIRLVWEMNPFIDGFTDQEGVHCNLKAILKKMAEQNTTSHNLLDEVMFAFGLDDGKNWHEPEVYYKPKFIKSYHLKIYDPNYITWVGVVEHSDAMTFFKKNHFRFDAIMKIRNANALYNPRKNEKQIETPTLEDFCDLIYSCKQLFCLTSGTATLAAVLKKPATVFYGLQQETPFRHSKMHNYILIRRTFKNQIKDKIKRPFSRIEINKT